MAPWHLQPLWARVRAIVAHPLFWFALAFVLLRHTAVPLSDHPDTLRDLLQARDCVESGHCIAGGAQASLGGMRSGAVWPSTLAALRWLGLPTEAVQLLVLMADSTAIALLAALQGAWPAGLLTAGLLWATREQLVWSPALMPLVAAMVAAVGQKARQSEHIGGWMALGACLGAQVDMHPVGFLYSSAVLLVVPWTAQRPVRAVGACSIAAVLSAGVLAPEVQFANLCALYQRSQLLLGLSVGAVLVSALSAQARAKQLQRTPAAWMTQPIAPQLHLLAAACLGASGVLIGVTLGVGAAHPRYFLAALPSLSLGLGPMLRMPNYFAPLLVVAFAWGLGPSDLGIGHPWPVVRHLTQVLREQGQSWPNYLYRLQGPGCRRLSAAVQVGLPESLSPTAASLDTAWQLLDLEPTLQPSGVGWQRSATWANGSRTLTTWVRSIRPWLRAHAGQACLQTNGRSECQNLRPGTLFAGAAKPPLGAIPWHMRTFPAAVTLAPASGPSRTTFKLPIVIDAAGSRRIALEQLPKRRCPWRFDDVRSDNSSLRWTLSADAQTLDATASAATRGALIVSRAWGGACDPLTEWEYGPPCMLETELAP